MNEPAIRTDKLTKTYSKLKAVDVSGFVRSGASHVVENEEFGFRSQEHGVAHSI